jgi:hypothetical protein
MHVHLPGSPPIWRDSPATKDDPISIQSYASLASSCAPDLHNIGNETNISVLAVLAAVSECSKSPVDWTACDIITDRDILVDLFHWVHGSKKELRIDVHFTGKKTLVLTLWTRIPKKQHTTEDRGRAYKHAETVPAPDSENSEVEGHERIVSYVSLPRCDAFRDELYNDHRFRISGNYIL